MTGIKETCDVVRAANEIGLFVIKHVKNFEMQSIPEIVQEILVNEQFRETLVEAVRGVSAVPSEVKDVDLFESLELFKLQMSYIPKLIGALKE